MSDTTTTPADPSPTQGKVLGLGDLSDFRTWITAVLVVGFFVVYAANWWTSGHATGDPQQTATKTLDLMNGALIAQFTGAVGYWLGSSRGSDAKTAILADNAQPKDKA